MVKYSLYIIRALWYPDLLFRLVRHLPDAVSVEAKGVKAYTGDLLQRPVQVSRVPFPLEPPERSWRGWGKEKRRFHGLCAMGEEVATLIFLSQGRTTLEKFTFHQDRFLLSIFSLPVSLPSFSYRFLSGALPQNLPCTKSLPQALLQGSCLKTAPFLLHLLFDKLHFPTRFLKVKANDSRPQLR